MGMSGEADAYFTDIIILNVIKHSIIYHYKVSLAISEQSFSISLICSPVNLAIVLISILSASISFATAILVHRNMQRMKFSYITPRPVHNGQDKSKQEEFKKKS